MANKRKAVTENTEVQAQTAQRRTYRASVNGVRNRLTVKGKEAGFVYRVVNDDEDRVMDLQERGYEIVTHKAQIGDKRVGTPTAEGSPVQISVGGNKKAYLMRIKEEWYKEDQAAKHEQVDALEQAIKGETGDYGKIKVEQRTDGMAPAPVHEPR